MNKKIILAILVIGLSPAVFARGTSSAIFVDPYFNMGALGIGGSSDLNDKINDIRNGNTAKGVLGIETASDIKWSKNLGVFMGYRFKHRYNIGLLIDYTSANAFFSKENASAFNFYFGSTTPTAGKYYEYGSGFSSTTFGPALYYTVYNGGKLTLDVGLGILYALKINYHEDTTYSTISSSDTAGLASHAKSVIGSGKGFGFLLGTSTSYYLTNYLGLSFDLAYRYLKSGTLTDPNGKEIDFTWADGSQDPTPAPLSVNLSGLYFGISLKIDFDISSSGSTAAAKPEETGAQETAKQAQETTTGWEDTAVAPVTDNNPTIDELRDIKKQVQRKWNDLRSDTSAEAQKQADRYRRLYDIVIKFEKDWDQATPQVRAVRIDKIKTFLAH
ncbi:MAG: hypothetical protein NTY22_06905 [Proteobacteria bacterium]|nr:hypothetical protein [Pseudomonadota bacterium]